MKAMAKNPIRSLHQQQNDSCVIPGSGVDGLNQLSVEVNQNDVDLQVRDFGEQKLLNGEFTRDEVAFMQIESHTQPVMGIKVAEDGILTTDISGKAIWWTRREESK